MSEANKAQWIDIGSLDDVPDNDVFPVTVNGHEFALYGVDGQVYVTDNLCTHGAAKLSDGFLEARWISHRPSTWAIRWPSNWPSV